MYQLIANSDKVKHLPSGFEFSMPPTESFGYDYAAWLAAGNTPQPAPEPPPPPAPQAVTMRQARLALLQAGLLDDIETAINSLPSPQKEAARIQWEYSQEVQRHNGFVAVLAPTIGLSEAQLDQMFFAAAEL